ncbi:MAG TPA: prepilin peptidase [Pseudonocardiaceae bacterium]|nr:prepilin peptidase [Pseudonocardiaceae bacterium]
MIVFPLCVLTVLGLVVGSFLNVVVYRVPRGEPLAYPPSHCPLCLSPVRHRHNVPVLGWLILRGRCADCRARISIRYPLVELVTGLLFLAIAAWATGSHLIGALLAFLYFASIGIALGLIDLDTHRLPNTIVLPSYPVLAILLTLAAGWQQDWWALARAGIGAAALLGFYCSLVVIYPAGMGWGDVKLAGLVGAMLGYLSWSALLVGSFGGFFLGALVGITVIAAGRGNRGSALPFGPFMMAGALVAIFAAGPIARAGLSLVAKA